MTFTKNLSFILLSFFILAGCGKDKAEQKDSQKMNEKKEALTEQKNAVDNKSVSNTSSDIKLYTVTKVEKSNGKKVAPNFTWTENGKEVSLNSLKGNVVLVNLWATWCGPCIKEMPDLSTISEELKDKKFRMLGMNVFQQERSKKVEDFLKTNPVSYTILDGNQQVVDAFGEANGANIEAVPTTFIIDKDGKIAETIVGGRDKESFLKLINKYMN
ncbi:MAG TPA: TlpA disulfide reductase family protein [Ignavibacteria bacterium]|nr:TlpA disulfide reductase family protein [Ignavibacteria bacterium]